ncbi:Profilin/allergen [Polyplosphaeria fusca]|uniref:Profilin n=1 Tax=Polyplosphaeria fusca TaxID=682080 RepID=A0A9P4QVQ6_9PLEO|nr:Profilin/allergen [Polyplosphaeria fusca]
MSWQAYVDQSLVGTGNIDQGIICDATDKTIWAATPGFDILGPELQVIIDSFTDKSPTKKVIEHGIKINGEKYMVIESTEDSLKAKKGKEGVLVAKTNKALLIGHHPADIQTTNAYAAVAALAEYLKGTGY